MLLTDKNILVMGVANKWSIAWGIAKQLKAHGARVIFSYYGETSLKNLEKLLVEEGFEDALTLECNVSEDADIEKAFSHLKTQVPVLNGVVHSIAHAKKEELAGRYADTSREGFRMAQDISAYSFVTVTKHAEPLMAEGGAFITITYLGGERVVKNYNVMGVAKASLEASVKYLAFDLGERNIRVNAISAGPIKTLAAKGVSGFGDLVKNFEDKAPLHRMVTPDEVGKTAVYLMSDLASGVTGENIHVDCGYHILGF